MKLIAMLGGDTANSRAPALMNRALSSAGLDAHYHPFDTTSAKLEAALDALLTLGVTGISISTPLKGFAANVVGSLTPLARGLGAVNCVSVKGGALLGHNTDTLAAEETLRRLRLPEDYDALFIGAGAAVRAFVRAFFECSAGTAHVANKDRARAESVKAAFADTGRRVLCHPLDAESLAEVTKGCKLVVQATSAYRGGHAELPFPFEAIDERTTVLDLNYSPPVPPFLAKARARTNRAHNGLSTLLANLSRSAHVWLGRKLSKELREAAAYLGMA